MDQTLEQLLAAGAPAFPSKQINCDGSEWVWNGMTLRDYFAAKAMPGLIAILFELRGIGNIPETMNDDDIFAIASVKAYALADAMLKEKQK